MPLLYKYVAHEQTHTHKSSEDAVLQEQLCYTVVVLEHVMNLMCCHVTSFPEQPDERRGGIRRGGCREETLPPPAQNKSCKCSLRSLPFLSQMASASLYFHHTLKTDSSLIFLCLYSLFHSHCNAHIETIPYTVILQTTTTTLTS